ncbi:MAG: hypothetical protein NW220_16740 [Leptolyngbyaceae cyanobacterium bins.349]|nr:hypothetical protein [Leptolyngbyaceae cyanobacterium bins.349]
MEILAIVAFTGIFLALLESLKPPKPKTVEEELGAAITKYLSKGVKVRIEQKD